MFNDIYGLCFMSALGIDGLLWPSLTFGTRAYALI